MDESKNPADINILTYRIASQDARGVLELLTYLDGVYIGRSKGYPKKSIVEIYPWKMQVPTRVNLRQTRNFDELRWA